MLQDNHSILYTILNWNSFNKEITRLKQVFINNNFPNNLFDNTLKRFIEKEQKSKTRMKKNTSKSIMNIKCPRTLDWMKR